MTKALDYFDPAAETGDDLVQTLEPVTAKFLVVSFSSDWRFSSARSREIVDALIASRKSVAFADVESDHGHDSFLLPLPRYTDLLAAYLGQVHKEVAV